MSLKTQMFGGSEDAFQSRLKGNRNEVILAKLLSDWTGVKFQRTPRSGGIHALAEFCCGDVMCVSREFIFPFSVETKHYKVIGSPNGGMFFRKNSKMLKFWKQAQADADRSKKKPMLLARQNGMPKGEYYVCLPITLEVKIGIPVVAYLRDKDGFTVAFCVMATRLFANPYSSYGI